jgi:hypothetical protein
MRLKSAIWVAAYIRRCNGEGAYAVVRRRGAEDAGAIFIKLNRLDGTADLFAPAPQTAFDEARPTDRAFSRSFGKDPVPEQKVEDKLANESRFDPDVWIVEVEDRAGRHFIENVVA